MIRKHVRLISLVLLGAVLVLFACSGDHPREIYETAQLEELQFNPEHATKLYNDIIRKYPESPYADKARKRLQTLKNRKPKEVSP